MRRRTVYRADADTGMASGTGPAPGSGEQELLAAYPSLRAEDLVNAWAYARSHAADIEAQIRENEAA